MYVKPFLLIGPPHPNLGTHFEYKRAGLRRRQTSAYLKQEARPAFVVDGRYTQFHVNTEKSIREGPASKSQLVVDVAASSTGLAAASWQ